MDKTSQGVEAVKEYREGRSEKSYRVLSRAFEMLERCAVKVARTVLRGGKCRKAPTYPEQATAKSLRSCVAPAISGA